MQARACVRDIAIVVSLDREFRLLYMLYMTTIACAHAQGFENYPRSMLYMLYMTTIETPTRARKRARGVSKIILDLDSDSGLCSRVQIWFKTSFSGTNLFTNSILLFAN